VVGIVLAALSAILILPLGTALVGTASSGSPAFWVVLAVSLVVLVPVYFVVFGFLGAQSSTYWTLAFRRLDLDYTPPQAPPPPQQAPAP
jgi:surface polysaccharide O-acyltransferase-like enzyme